ncbi:MAG: outer membrane beta-barrel protein [Bacteroidetes bacterium]|nr:outer membrane beta-barrel protein [Bacteroidota bacterium]
MCKFKVFSFIFFLIGSVWATQVQAQAESDFLTGKGLLFKFDGLANLGLNSFSGGAGLKYKIGEEAWLRHIVSLSANRANPHGTKGVEGKNSNYTLQLSSDFIMDMYKRDKLKPYYGAGIDLMVGNSYNLSENPMNKYTSNSNSYSAGITGLIGIEYFVKDYISLSAEYNLGFGFQYTENKSESTNKERQLKTKSFSIPTRGFYLNTSSFGLVASFYL